MLSRRLFFFLPPGIVSACWALLLLPGNPLQGAVPPDFEFIDGGQKRGFWVAQDEVFLQWHGAGSPADPGPQIEALGIGATTLKSTDGHALVRLAKPLDDAKLRARTDEFSVAFPGVQVLPVLYEAGSTRDQGTRRVVMTRLLAQISAGEGPEDVGARVGAKSASQSSVPGLALLEMAGPFEVLEALVVLRQAGIQANPLLGHFPRTLSISLPKDEFFPYQWHLHNTADKVTQPGAVFGIDANVLDAWQVTLGGNITIGIVDSCLELTHPDLADNIPPVNSGLHYDFLDGDADPSPHVGDRHGTSVAGVAAARQNNGPVQDGSGARLGVSGAAPDARLLGLRLINESGNVPVTDLEESQALFWKPAASNFQPVIDVSNNSWGPPTPFVGLIGPDVLTLQALHDATLFGREGRGQVTLFAAGNDALNGSDANFSAYGNSRYVIAVGAMTSLGVISYYSELGSNVLVSAPSGGGGPGALDIVTTDITNVGGYNPPFPGVVELPNTDYTNEFSGTSSATPLASGVAALMLSANADLGWRDVKEILAATARQVDPQDVDWLSDNGAGFKFNHKYGGGMVDASAAVVRSLEWQNLTQETTQVVNLPAAQLPTVIPDGNLGGAVLGFDFSGPNYPNLRVETVEVTVDIDTKSRSDLSITLTSPSGTQSRLAVGGGIPQGNDQDYKYATFHGPGPGGGWTFTTVHDWGENSTGTWTLQIVDNVGNGIAGTLNSASLHIYGTSSSMERFNFQSPRYTVLGPATDLAAPVYFTATVTRSGPSTDAVQVDYLTSARGTARGEGPGVSNPDYRPVSGTLSFPAGVTTQTITVPILHDPLLEGDKSIYLLLKNPVGGSLGGVTLATVTVINPNVNTVTVLPTALQATEPLPGAPVQAGTFTIARAFPTTFPVDVQFRLAGTATAPTLGGLPQMGADYDVSGAPAPTVDSSDLYTVTIPANQTLATITITARADGVIEGTETVDLTLANVVPQTGDASYSVGSPSTAEIRIIDADRPAVKIEVAANFVLQEKDPTKIAAVQLSLITPDGKALTFPLAVDLAYSGTQINGIDYIDADAPAAQVNKSLPPTVTIPAGDTSLVLHIAPVPSPGYQSSKTIVIGLSPNSNYTIGFPASAALTVVEDDPAPIAATSIPSLMITAPKGGVRFVAPATVTVTGTAANKSKGNTKVNAVEYSINGSTFAAMPGVVPGATVSWSLSLNLPTNPAPEVVYGPNFLKVRSVDQDGNRSQSGVLTFSYVKERAIAFTPLGTGSVSGKGLPKSGALEVGRSYTLTAQPGPGQVFVQWNGLSSVTKDVVNPLSRTITFTVADGVAASLQPQFVTSPFGAGVTGNYAGLAQGNAFAFGSAGFLNLSLMSNGGYTAKLTLAGAAYSFKGEFTGGGFSTGIIPRKNDLPYYLDLTLDLAAQGTQRITGIIKTPAYVLAVTADHAGLDAGVAGKAAGAYTLVLPPNVPLGNADFDPRGTGYGSYSIDSSGVVKGSGMLADGSKFMFAQALNKDLQWPFFLDLYKHRGVITGTVSQYPATVQKSGASVDADGAYAWLKGSDAKDPSFPLGFIIPSNTLQASRYTAAAGRALSVFTNNKDNAEILITDGTLISTIDKLATFDATNNLVIDEAASSSKGEGLTLKIDAKNGLFSGAFIHPLSGKTLKVGGVLLQAQSLGRGGFVGYSYSGVPLQTGTITLKPH